MLEEIVDLGDVLVGELLGALLGAPLLVVADVAVSDELLEMVHAVPADVANGDPALLGEVADDLDQLLRRSSVSCGIGSRIILPSFEGVSPSSDSWSARSIDLIELGSYGWIVSRRGSGTLIVESWFSGVSWP